MSYLIVALMGVGVGYIGAYFQHNPERRAEIAALFKKKAP